MLARGSGWLVRRSRGWSGSVGRGVGRALGRRLEVLLVSCVLVYVVLFLVHLALPRQRVPLTAAMLSVVVVGVLLFGVYFAQNSNLYALRVLSQSLRMWMVVVMLAASVCIHLVEPEHSFTSPVNGFAYSVGVLGLLMSDVFVHRHRMFWLTSGTVVTVATLANIVSLTLFPDEKRVLVTLWDRPLLKGSALRSVFVAIFLLLTDGLYTLFTSKNQSRFFFLKGRIKRPQGATVSEHDRRIRTQRYFFLAVCGFMLVLLYVLASFMYFRDDCSNCIPWWLVTSSIVLSASFVAVFVWDARTNASPELLPLLVRQVNLWLIVGLLCVFVTTNVAHANEAVMSPVYSVTYALCILFFIVSDTFMHMPRRLLLGLAMLGIATSAFGAFENLATDLDQGESVFRIRKAHFFKSDINRTIYFNMLLLLLEAYVSMVRDKERVYLMFARAANIPRDILLRKGGLAAANQVMGSSTATQPGLVLRDVRLVEDEGLEAGELPSRVDERREEGEGEGGGEGEGEGRAQGEGEGENGQQSVEAA